MSFIWSHLQICCKCWLSPRRFAWVKMYDSLFITLNENGLVKGFQLTMGTSFEKVTDLFEELALINSELQYLFVDNCCTVKNNLQKFFPHASIKLDIFHAVQRLTKHMTKRHPFFNEAVKCIGMVFRCPEDIGKERKFPTPEDSVILANLQSFLSNWKKLKHKEWKLVNAKVEHEYHNLQAHIVKRCLSGIPVGIGTNRNGVLHKTVK